MFRTRGLSRDQIDTVLRGKTMNKVLPAVVLTYLLLTLPSGSLLAADFDAEVRSIGLSPSDVAAGETGSIYADFRNLSAPNGPYGGAATFDARIVITKPGGSEYIAPKGNWGFTSSGQQLRFTTPSYYFSKSGQYKVVAEIYDIFGEDTGWDVSHRFDTMTRYFTLDFPNTPPSASRQSPSNREVRLYEGDSQVFVVRGTDPDGDLDGVKWYRDGDYVDEWDSLSGSSGTASRTERFSEVDDYLIEAVVYDEEGEHNTTYWDVEVREKKGSLRVQVRHSENDILVAGSELNALQLYKDNSFDGEVNPTTADYTFPDLSPRYTYRVDAYGTDMYIGSGSEYLSPGENASEEISAHFLGTVRIRTLYADGISPLDDAYVELRSHEGTAWRSGFSDVDGWISWSGAETAHVFPNQSSGERWRVYVFHSGNQVADPIDIGVEPSTETSLDVVTDLETKGDLSVSVVNQNGDSPPVFDKIIVQRWQNGSFVDEKSSTSSNQFTWNDIPAGVYRFDAYVEGPNPFDSLGEFWTTKQSDVSAGSNPPLILQRDWPYSKQFGIVRIEDGWEIPFGAEIQSGRELRLEAVVRNDLDHERSVRTNIILDRDKQPNWDYSDQTDYLGIRGSDTEVFTSLVTPSASHGGLFHGAVKTETEPVGKTDSWDWFEAYSVIPLPSSQQSAGNLDFSGLNWTPIDWDWQFGLYSGNVFEEADHLILRVTDGAGIGSQLNSTRQDFHYGEYTAVIKAAPATACPDGVTQAFFYYVDDFNEIDVEILSADPGFVHFVVQGGEHFRVAVPNQSMQYHTYGFRWESGLVEFLLDGSVPQAQVITGGATCTAWSFGENKPARTTVAVPSAEGKLIINNWTGNPGWSGFPPKVGRHSDMLVRNVTYTPTATTGNLEVTIQDQNGVSRTNATCVLFDGAGSPMGTDFDRISDPDCTWSGLPAAAYSVEVYFWGASPLPGAEFWASGYFDVTVGSTTNGVVQRDMPYASAVVMHLDQSNGPVLSDNSMISTASSVWASVGVQQTTGATENSRVEIAIDPDSGPVTFWESAAQNVPPESSVAFDIPIDDLGVAGNYSFAPKVETWVNGSYTKTDGWDWVPTFEAVELLDVGGGTPQGSVAFSEITWNKMNWTWQNGLFPTNVFPNGSDLVLRVKDASGIGAQANSVTADYQYGEYTAEIKPAQATSACPWNSSDGVAQGFFYYWGESDEIFQEIDVEILSRDPNAVHFVVHHNGAKRHFRAEVGDQANQYHEYGFLWLADRVEFLFNGAVAQGRFIDTTNPGDACSGWNFENPGGPLQAAIVTAADITVPARPGTLILNHWSGNPGWSGIPPSQGFDRDMRVRSVSYQLFECSTNADCDDSFYCNGTETCNTTNHSCDPGTPPVCDDGAFCNGAETCNEGTDGCDPGTPPVCDDGVGCTVDSCNEAAGSCENTSSDSLCGNGLFCDGAETCHPLNDCQAGAAVTCSDGVGCTIDSCNEVTDACDNTPNDSLCDNGLFCDGSETCHEVNDCQAESDPCPGQSCDEDGDSCGCLVDADCIDGLFCNGVETCLAGSCQAGTPPVCDDGVGCTVDSCNETTGSCENTSSDSLCDNGLFCDGAETCDPLNDCQAGAAVTCSDGIGCTVDSCNEATDACDNMPNDWLCDNGLFCDGSETCHEVNDCQAESDPCPGQSCDEDGDSCGCLVDADCIDGLFCNGVETCLAGSCQAGTPPVCDDGVGCTVDSCNETTGSCENTSSDSLCGNGLFCDGAETCDPLNGCQAGLAVTCSDGVGCTVDSCNEATGSCENTPSDSLCDNGFFCDGAETCDPLNDCQAGAAVTCPDGVGCTIDSCNEATDACDNTPNDSLCDNDLFCDGSESCHEVKDCQAGSEPCPGQSCDEDADSCGCLVDADCIDGLFCNGVETCLAGSCQAGTPPVCDDGVGCTVDSCNEAAGSCENTSSDSLCGNGLFCDGAETCHPLNDCQAGAAVTCSDGVGCTVDSCNEAIDSCENTSSDSLCDNGLFCDGSETCDVIGGCQPALDPCDPLACDEDGDVCFACNVDADCSNGLFCDGAEICNSGICQAGRDPCAPMVCDEGNDICLEGAIFADSFESGDTCAWGGNCPPVGEWFVQEDPDDAAFEGCWSVFPTNFRCDGNSYLVDGDYTTGSVAYMHNQDAILDLDYQIPDGTQKATWTVSFRAGDPVNEMGFVIDAENLLATTINFRIIVTNTASIGAPFRFEIHDGSAWTVLYSGVTSSRASAIVFEERMDWFILYP